MKTKSLIIISALALMAAACSEDHVYYNTAAKSEIVKGADEYEVGVPITFTDNTVPSKGTTIKSYLWEFGDEDESTSTDQSPVFTYKKDGTYVVALTVTDSNDLKSRSTRTVKVINPTKADFTLDREEYYLGDEVKFFDASTTKGSTTIVGWHWEFADAARTTSDVQNPTFLYTEAGSYPVKLTITDSFGLTTSITRSVNIQDPSQIIATQWQAELGGAVKGGSSAAMSPDGSTIYMLRSLAGDEAAALVAYNAADGQKQWSLELSQAMSGVSPNALAKDVFSSPSVSPDGTINVVVRDLQSTTADRGVFVLGINPNATVKYAYKGGVSGTNLYAITPAVDAAGNVYVATRGKEIWKMSPAGAATVFADGLADITGGMSIAKDGTAYAAGKGNLGLFAYNTSANKLAWNFNTDFGGASDAFTGALRSTAATIGADGTVYYAIDKAAGGAVLALSPAGNLLWSYDTAGAIPDGGVVIGADGTLYVNGGTDAATGLIALNANGSLKWAFATEAMVQTAPVVDNRGYIHVVDARANYYVVKEDGSLLAQSKLADACTSTPLMDARGNLYLAVTKGGAQTVMCVSSKAAGYADSAWPMRGQNPSRTGCQK